MEPITLFRPQHHCVLNRSDYMERDTVNSFPRRKQGLEVKSLTHVKRTSPALRILAGPQNRNIRPTGDPIIPYRCWRQGGQLSEVCSKETLSFVTKIQNNSRFLRNCPELWSSNTSDLLSKRQLNLNQYGRLQLGVGLESVKGDCNKT